MKALVFGRSGQLATTIAPSTGSLAKGLDAMLLVRIAKQRALNETKQLAAKHDPTAFPRVKTFARLQLTNEELDRWL